MVMLSLQHRQACQPLASVRLLWQTDGASRCACLWDMLKVMGAGQQVQG